MAVRFPDGRLDAGPPTKEDAKWQRVVIICACIVAAGIFFGLRSSGPTPSSPSPSTYSRPDSQGLTAPMRRMELPGRTAPGNDDTRGVVVFVTRTGKKYHRGSCSYLRKSKISMSLSEARGQYGPCSRCRPPM